MIRLLIVACILIVLSAQSSVSASIEQVKKICDCEKADCQKELFSLLSDADEYVASYAASCLEKQKTVDMELLENAVHSNNEKVIALGLRVFAKHGHCCPFIASYLESDSPVLRAQSAYAIGELKCEQFEQQLTDLLWDRHISVRTQTIEALGKIGNPSSLSKIIEFLNSPHDQIAQATIKAVIKYQNRAVEPLKKIVLNGERQELRARAALALAAITTPEASKALSEILDARDKDAVGAALFALKNRKDKSLVPKIEKYLKDDYQFGRFGKLSELAEKALENQKQ